MEQNKKFSVKSSTSCVDIFDMSEDTIVPKYKVGDF